MSSIPQPHPSQLDSGPGPKDVVPSIAERYMVDEGVVRRLMDQLKGTCATACSFDIPELGGRGQWSPGHVTGAPGADHSLRMRIDGLCSELAALIRGMDTAAPEALATDPHTAPVGSRFDLAAGPSWWPASFGVPASSGDQHGVRFAFFPHVKRLLIQKGAHIEAHDTADYTITGMARAQGSSALTFDSNRGPVGLDQLKCVPVA
jgi:hypothetical protein